MLVPVILSGGAGTRLWPVSRAGHPKPFMPLPGGQTLLQKAYLHAGRLAGGGDILTVTNRDYFFLSCDEFAKTGLNASQCKFLLEPEGRNTAPAIAAAALWLRAAHGEEAVMLVMAADHLIRGEEAFTTAVLQAAEAARQGDLITFGIEPDHPETGFGYIEMGAATAMPAIHAMKRFVEKPDRARAEQFLAKGGFLWNSGMFCFTAGAVLRELAEHAPDLLRDTEASLKSAEFGKPGAGPFALEANAFARVPNISIDVAVMEKSRNVKVVKGDFGWSDVGSWEAVSHLLDADAGGNRAGGDTVLIDAKDNFIYGNERVVAAVGVNGLMIVDTPDALLVVAKDRAQDVKQVVEALRTRGHETFRSHRTVTRPWGTYTVLEEGPGFKIKRIVVKPGASLSLQMHHHRSEHWVVVSGRAKVTNGSDESIVQKNESTYIPAGNKHRLENPQQDQLVLIEVQSGDYVGEDDIVRFEDKYGRV